ncbi:MAG: ArsR/SmtB family transcription factor [Actinocrinis sp.]
MTAADEVFAALASPTRRDVLALLRDGPQPVHALAAHFAIRRPSLSEHLKVLKDAGLVVESRHGRERHYALDATPLREIAGWLTPYEQFWRHRLGALADYLDQESHERTEHHQG